MLTQHLKNWTNDVIGAIIPLILPFHFGVICKVFDKSTIAIVRRDLIIQLGCIKLCFWHCTNYKFLTSSSDLLFALSFGYCILLATQGMISEIRLLDRWEANLLIMFEIRWPNYVIWVLKPWGNIGPKSTIVGASWMVLDKYGLKRLQLREFNTVLEIDHLITFQPFYSVLCVILFDEVIDWFGLTRFLYLVYFSNSILKSWPVYDLLSCEYSWNKLESFHSG